MNRRSFLKLTTLAGPGFAAGGMLGAMTDSAQAAAASGAALPLPGPGVDFAIVGDFGAGNYSREGELIAGGRVNPDCLAVANTLKQFAPVRGSAYIISVGDQIYIPFAPGDETMPADVANYDTAIGQLFYPYIQFPASSTSAYKNKGSKTQRFFCLLGDHDWWHQPQVTVDGFIDYDTDSLDFPQSAKPQTQYLQDAPLGAVSPFMDYFSEQGLWSATQNPRYYDLLQGSIHWFALSSDPNETLYGTLNNAYNYTGEISPELTAGQDNLLNSTQGQWLSGAVPLSTAPWKIVMLHNPPFVSSQPHSPYFGHYPAAYMQWGYDQMGVDAVISGHAHAYERLFINNCTYIVCGSGGTFEALSEFSTPLAGSVVRVANRFGFMTGKVTPQVLELLYVVVNAADEPGVVQTLDRCLLLKGGTLGVADKLGQATSIIITAGGGAINTTAPVLLLPGALLGAGVLTKLGQSTLMITGMNNFGGTLLVSQGTVQLLANQTLAAASSLQLAGGKLDARGRQQNFATPLQAQGAGQMLLNTGTRLAFADSSATAWPGVLIIVQGILGAQSLRFGTSASGLTAGQCQQIRIGSATGPAIALDALGYAVNSKTFN
jgi:autotransporter-associated beta strand protein